MSTEQAAAPRTIDAAEVAHFSTLAARWWDPKGPMAGLHQMNPARIGYIRDQVATAFGRDASQAPILAGLDVLDLGCGAGVLTEPLARLGGRVTGLDATADAIDAARHHAAERDLAITYRVGEAATLAAEGQDFDVVVAMEIVEHVADVETFVADLARLVRPGGLAVLSTINRTKRAYGMAIVAGEYLLNWVPRGTHQYAKLVRPAELAHALRSAGLRLTDLKGLVFERDGWRTGADVGVNYIVAARG
ncbi:bifunctional 2-polyprenyl-6-hydroxyphenol methylase/3-demethylubiquinol 3-O-methyltransferase UbiG [Zavarzinia sp. CC-PAN008]|uniref:bifunctional 2-polyprenyl-6-hydroxyphenol methylase/3-demethylubiquinol 3-O-methyltransferase UbiG n=1 Tax=Zavarzinia sp. CC-PAN008 TaxID=3243332 RepID=UPI003F746507